MSETTLQVTHNFKGHLWCGIGALSAATGITTSAAKRIIRSVSLRKYIKAVTYSEMAHALTAMGHKIKREFYPRNAKDCPTLHEWLHGQMHSANRTYVICITGHWVVVRCDEWVCSMNQKARHVTDCPYLKAKVRHVVSFDHTDSGS